MCNLCAVVLGGSITNDKCDVKNKIYIQITAFCMVQEAAHTGLKETPSESMDQKAMIVCICLWVLNIWISFLAL